MKDSSIMKKPKTYVLIVAKEFPKGHDKEGLDTEFPEKILTGDKIHTIRFNYPLWEKRIDEINKGNAVLSIRFWEDKPYRSKQIEIKQLKKVGIQKLTYQHLEMFFIDDRQRSCFVIAKNDGLTWDDFKSWFSPLKKLVGEELAVIHFTGFRY